MKIKLNQYCYFAVMELGFANKLEIKWGKGRETRLY